MIIIVTYSRLSERTPRTILLSQSVMGSSSRTVAYGFPSLLPSPRHYSRNFIPLLSAATPELPKHSIVSGRASIGQPLSLMSNNLYPTASSANRRNMKRRNPPACSNLYRSRPEYGRICLLTLSLVSRRHKGIQLSWWLSTGIQRGLTLEHYPPITQLTRLQSTSSTSFVNSTGSLGALYPTETPYSSATFGRNFSVSVVRNCA